MAYPATLEVIPLPRPPHATVRVPGSKSITNRALVLTALYWHEHSCRLVGALQSEDTELMVAALRQLGYDIAPQWDAAPPAIDVGPARDAYAPRPAELFLGNSGTSMRFLAAVASLGVGRFRLDGVPRMRERPIQDLLAALHQAGVAARSELGNGCPPIVIDGHGGWTADLVRVRADVSSQFLSALLMVAPLACRGQHLDIVIDGPVVSRPYIDMTYRLMTAWHLPIERDGPVYRIRHAGALGWTPPVASYTIEPDASAASYFFAAAALTGGRVQVPDLTADSLQGDVRFVELLEQMGCRVERWPASLVIHGGPLHGIDVDMNDVSDTVMTLAVVACFADGPTRIRNVAHIRHKETDRLAALALELRRLGAGVVEHDDGLTITPQPLHGAHVQTYHDHRMAMSLALAGLRVPGVVIDNPGCVAKTYPAFFTDLETLR